MKHSKFVGNAVKRDKFRFGLYILTDPFGPTICAVYWGYSGYVWYWKQR